MTKNPMPTKTREEAELIAWGLVQSYMQSEEDGEVRNSMSDFDFELAMFADYNNRDFIQLIDVFARLMVTALD